MPVVRYPFLRGTVVALCRTNILLNYPVQTYIYIFACFVNFKKAVTRFQYIYSTTAILYIYVAFMAHPHEVGSSTINDDAQQCGACWFYLITIVLYYITILLHCIVLYHYSTTPYCIVLYCITVLLHYIVLCCIVLLYYYTILYCIKVFLLYY